MSVGITLCVSGVVGLTPEWEKPFGSENQRAFLLLAERTGLEPATPDVTGRYSNQLNYHSKLV